MKFELALTGFACCWSGAALGQAATAPQPSPPATAKSDGAGAVLSYPPAFFADAKPTTALDMIARLPGFTLDVGAIDARGLAGTAGNVLINGKRPTSKSDTVYDVLGRISASSVARIDLIRGGAPGIDMQGRAIVANVVLKDQAKTEIVAETDVHGYSSGLVAPSLTASYSRRAGERQTEVSITAGVDAGGNNRRGERSRTDAAGVLIDRAALDLDDRLRTIDMRGSIARPLSGGKLNANAVLRFIDYDDTQDTRVLLGPDADDRITERSRYPNGELGFTWTRSLGPRGELEFTGLQRLSRSTYSGVSISPGAIALFASGATAGESVFRSIYRYRKSDDLSFEGGGEVAYNFLDSSSAYTQDGVVIALPNAAIQVSEVRGEGFVQSTWRPASDLTIEAGMRVELSRISLAGDTRSSKSFVYPKPRLQLTWLPVAGTQFRLRIEQEVGQLNFGDFAASSEITLGTVLGGNADLRPQRATVIEMAYERRFWGKGALELTYRHSAVSDVIDNIPLVGGFEAVGNIGDGTIDYVNAALTLPFDRLGLKSALFKGSLGWTWPRATDPLTGERRRFGYESGLACSVSFSQDLRRGRFTLGIDHDCNTDRSYSYRASEFRTDVYPPFLTIYGQWKPSARLTARIDLGNVGDVSARSLRDVYDGPRNAAPLLFREERATKRGRFVFLKVRRTL